jgi:ketosteroid isomerase-like protein
MCNLMLGELQTEEEFGTGLGRIRMVVELLHLSGEPDIEGITALLHPQMHMLAAPGVAPVRSYESREEFLQYFSDAAAHEIVIRPDVHEIRISPTGAILAAGRLQIAGRVVDETDAWFVYTFRDGKIASLETYLDRAMAEDAAGFSGDGCRK